MNGSRKGRIMAVTSGKGGVGKTNLAVNMAVALSDRGQKVLVFDADLGLANLDVMLGITPQYNLRHVIECSRSLEDIVVAGPSGISIIPASSGVSEMADLPKEHTARLITGLCELTSNYDVVLIDTPSGIGANVLRFAWMADDVVLVTTPEPTAITDSYALIKLLRREKPDVSVRLVVNMADNTGEASRVAGAFSEITNRFLGCATECMGSLTFDPIVPLAVRRQQPFVTCYPHSVASRNLRLMCRRILSPRESLHTPEMEFQYTNRVNRWLKTWQGDEET